MPLWKTHRKHGAVRVVRKRNAASVGRGFGRSGTEGGFAQSVTGLEFGFQCSRACKMIPDWRDRDRGTGWCA